MNRNKWTCVRTLQTRKKKNLGGVMKPEGIKSVPSVQHGTQFRPETSRQLGNMKESCSL